MGSSFLQPAAKIVKTLLPKSTLEKKRLLKVVKMITIGTWFDLCQISQLIL